MAVWQTRAYGESGASVPPEITTRASVRSTRRACPSASSPAACSVTSTLHGPLAVCRMETWPVVAA